MELIEHRIVVPTECTPVRLLPFSCVHLDNPGHSASHWAAFKRDVQESPHTVVLGLGDYYDWLRTHARKFLERYEDDDTSFDRLHDWRKQKAAEFANELRPFRDKIALLSKGNHVHQFPEGTNDVQEMCRLLKVPYGGHGGFLRLSICTPQRGAHVVLNILYHHGEKIGGGSTIGGDINAMAKKAQGWEFDVFIVAHNHQKHGTHKPVLMVPKKGKMELVERPKAFIRAGCHMRGYVRGCVTYAEAAGLMEPTALGHVVLTVMPKKGHGNRIEHDFKVTY